MDTKNIKTQTFCEFVPGYITEEDAVRSICRKLNVSRKCFTVKISGDEQDKEIFKECNDNPNWDCSNTWKMIEITGSRDLIKRYIEVSMKLAS